MADNPDSFVNEWGALIGSCLAGAVNSAASLACNIACLAVLLIPLYLAGFIGFVAYMAIF